MLAEKKYEDITVEISDRIAWVTINRPEAMNAIRLKTVEELLDVFTELDLSEEVDVILLTGAGDKAFCAGGDVKEFQELFANPTKARQYLNKWAKMIKAIRECSKPVIAVINGVCVGGGNEIQQACDLAIASEDARIGQVGPRVGSTPIFGGIQYMSFYVGDRRARYQMYTTELWTAKEAEQIGLINKAVPKEKLREEAENLAKKILANSPQAIRAVKIWINYIHALMAPTYDFAVEVTTRIWNTDEAREGIRAFLEKRKPEWDKYRYYKPI